jgi:hypothetical protein
MHQRCGTTPQPGIMPAMTPTRTTIATTLTALALTALTACSTETEMRVSRDDLPSGEWPFTVDAGDLSCEDVPGATAILLEVDGTTYAVNGPAIAWAADRGWTNKAPIWADHPDDDLAKIPTTALERWADEHC